MDRLMDQAENNNFYSYNGEAVNSTILMKKIEELSGETRDKIDVGFLATVLNITLPKLIAVLTELEHRDKIKIDITSHPDAATGELNQGGTVQLMDTPPDELTSTQVS